MKILKEQKNNGKRQPIKTKYYALKNKEIY